LKIFLQGQKKRKNHTGSFQGGEKDILLSGRKYGEGSIYNWEKRENRGGHHERGKGKKFRESVFTCLCRGGREKWKGRNYLFGEGRGRIPMEGEEKGGRGGLY